MSAATIPIALAFVTSVGWKLYQVARAPDDRQLRAVTLCLASAAVAFPIGLAEGRRAIDAAAGAGTAKLAQNILLLAAMYWLMSFYLYSAEDQGRGQRRARWETVPLLATAGTITAATVITPVAARNHTYATADMRIPGLAVFYLSAGLYLVYALTMASHWTLRHARVAPRPHSTGLGLAAIAMACMVLAGSARLVFVMIRWQGGTVPSTLPRAASLTVTLAVPVFLAGVTYPGAVARLQAARIWWQHWRTYHQLYPLWTLLHEAFPQDALLRTPSSRWRDVLWLRGLQRRYYRRLIECRDGLVRISPYVATVTAPGGTPSSMLAVQLRSALHRRRIGATATMRAVPIALPDRDGIDADAEPLVALAQALREDRGTTRPGRNRRD